MTDFSLLLEVFVVEATPLREGDAVAIGKSFFGAVEIDLTQKQSSCFAASLPLPLYHWLPP
jgi:hypothetical protein